MKKAVLVAIILVMAGIATAQAFPQYQERYVNDFAGVFDGRQLQSLRSILEKTEQETTAEISVVSVESCSPLSPGEYATGLFEQWGIGKAGADNGLLVLFCRDEVKIYAVTGYGLEGILPDGRLGRLLDEYYVPQRDAGKAAEGIIYFTEQVANAVSENKEEIVSKSDAESWMFITIFGIIFIGFIVLAIILAIKGGGGGYRYIRIRRRTHWGGRGIGGFSGGRSGFGGFGGGRTGGGGAGR